MTDEIFGEVFYEGYAWCGKVKTDIFDEEFELCVQADDESELITDAQRTAYKSFADNAQKLLPQMLEGMVKFYNGELKYSFGDDGMWCDIDTPQQMLEHIKPDTVIVPYDNIVQDEKTVYILFLCGWEADEAEQNGLAVQITNGEITDINTADIAF